MERKHWVEAMGGTWPAQNSLQRMRTDSVEENLNSAAFSFLKDCLAELEARGLREQGLYRVGGVVSKVKKLLGLALENEGGSSSSLDLSDLKLWESKTIASAVKKCFAELHRPLLTHQLYAPFLEAAKKESEAERLDAVGNVLKQLPAASTEILRVLMRHLHKVASYSNFNLMTAGNLSVCFGPSLLRPKEETVASIMDIKFCNEIVEILIENCDHFFPDANASSSCSVAESSPEVSAKSASTATSFGGPPPSSSRRTAKLSSPTASEESNDERSRRGSSTPKRTQSFSAFSQLSTNSLPDIKEFKAPTSHHAHHHTTGHHRHHHPDTPGLLRQQRTMGSGRDVPDGIQRPRSRSSQQQDATQSTEAIGVLKTAEKPNSQPVAEMAKHSPVYLMKSLTQDDLMASLEMMNSLAADLPTASTRGQLGAPLRRILTTGLRNTSNESTSSSGEVAKKPPLPKLLSLTSLSTSSAAAQNPFYRHNSSPSPCSSVSSGSPRMPRESDLPESASTTVASSSAVASAPPPPTRKYKRIVVSPGAMQEHAAKIADKDSGGGHTHKMFNKSNVSTDSGLMLLASPSPTSLARRRIGHHSSVPTESAFSSSSKLKHDQQTAANGNSDGCDALSVASSAISMGSDDNGELGEGNNADVTAPKYNGDDGDDEAEEEESEDVVTNQAVHVKAEEDDSSSLSDENLILDSSDDDEEGGEEAEAMVTEVHLWPKQQQQQQQHHLYR
jgi:hypothetical protein